MLKRGILKLKRKLVAVLSIAMLFSNLSMPIYAATEDELFFGGIDYKELIVATDRLYPAEETLSHLYSDGYFIINTPYKINRFTIHDSYAKDIEFDSVNKIIVRGENPVSLGVASASEEKTRSYIEFNEEHPGEKTYISFTTDEDVDVAVVVAYHGYELTDTKVYLKEVTDGGDEVNQEAVIPKTDRKNVSVIVMSVGANKTCYLSADEDVCLYYAKIMPKSETVTWDFTDENCLGTLGERVEKTIAYVDGLYVDVLSDGSQMTRLENGGISLSKDGKIYVPAREDAFLYIEAPKGFANIDVNGTNLTEAKEYFDMDNAIAASDRSGYVCIEVTKDAAEIEKIAWFAKADVHTIEIPTAKANLSYTGEEQTAVAEGTGYTVTGNKAMEVGTYTATLSLKEDYVWSDLTTADKTIEWSIEKASTGIVTVSMNGWTYGDKANEPEASGLGAAAATYTYSNEENGTYTDEVPVAAGTWYIKASVAETDSYLADEAVKSFEIAKKQLTVSANAVSKKYGAADPELTYTSKGLIGDDKISGTLTRETGENAGVYAIKQGTITAGENYDINFAGADFTIEKLSTISGTPKADMSVSYVCDSVEKVALPENWKWQTEDSKKELVVGTAVNATAVYTGEDKENYADTAKTVTVAVTRAACTHDGIADVAEVPASDTKDGVLAHSKCPVCQKLFVKDGEKLIEKTAEQLVIKANKSTTEPGEETSSDKSAADKTQDTILDQPTATVKEAGATISDTNSNAEMVVTSKPGEKPAVTFAKADEKAKNVKVPETITDNGITYTVTTIADGAFENCSAMKSLTIGANISKIGKKAFKGTGIKTLTIKTSKLTKKSVKGCLTGSKIKTIKVKVGNKKQNKAVIKKYQKIFTKKNVGKKVTVK